MKKSTVIITLLICSLFAGAQSIAINAPYSGQVFNRGEDIYIHWLTNGNIASVKLEWSTGTDTTWYTYKDSIRNHGYYYFRVPYPDFESNTKFRISNTYDSLVFDVSDTFTVQDVPLTANAGNISNICNGGNGILGSTSSTTTSASGGTPPYTYQWSPITNLSCTTCSHPYFYINNNDTVTYTLIVTDFAGDTATSQVIVRPHGPLAISQSTTHDLFYYPADTLRITATGGAPPYSAYWSMGSILANLDTIIVTAPGIYRGFITESGGAHCSASILDTIYYHGNLPPVISGVQQYSTNIDSTLTIAPYILSQDNDSSIITQILSNTATGAIVSISYPTTINYTPPPSFTGIDTVTYVVCDNNIYSLCDTGTFTINVNSLKITLDLLENVSCFGYDDGSIDITASGGVPPYYYSWSNAAAVEDLWNLPEGNYMVWVTDSVGNIQYRTFTITNAAPINLNATVTDISCNGQSNGSICLQPTGGNGNYNYSWFNGTSNACATGLSALNYAVYVTDTRGCYETGHFTIYEPTPITVTITSSALGTLPDTLNVSVTGGTAPYTYQWSNSVSTQQNIVTQYGQYHLTVTDANTCFTVDSIFVGCPDTCVWPGDADYSGTVDNNDLLAIGLGYGYTGTTRAQQDINWYAHSSTSWANNLPSGDNLKHADCNGDGTINDADTLAILQNYSLTHPRSGADVNRGNVAQLKVIMVPDTLEDGQTVIAHLLLGDTNFAATNVYGLAFTFNYDPLVVDSNEVSLTFNNASWLCSNATDHLDIDKPFYEAGQIKTAITRIDHTTRSGNGEIGQVSMKITTGNINGKNLQYYTMASFISDLIVIDSAGNHLQFDAGADSATIQYEPLGISNLNWNGEVDVYPNPTNNLVNIKSGNLPINTITIVNLLGETAIYQTGLNEKQVQLNTSTLPQGTYIMKLQSGKQMYYTRFVKAQ